MGIRLKARIIKWHDTMYSVEIKLLHSGFTTDSNNYKTIKQAKRSAESLAARMGWKLEWGRMSS